MDAEHRHELKTNELAQWFNNLPENIKKNRNQIIGVIFIIAAVISFFVLRSHSQKVENKLEAETTAQIQAIEQEKLTVAMGAMSNKLPLVSGFKDTANALAQEAEKAKKPTHAAMALIKMAEALRAELHYPIENLDQEKINSNIEKAKQAYETALVKARGDATLEAMATYGLGLCAEEIGDFDKAKEIFKNVAENEKFAGTIFTAQAQFRLDIMDDHKQQFTFVETPEPEVKTIPGLDKDAMDAVLRGDIHIEQPKVDTKKPDTETKADTEAKPDAEAKPDTEANTGTETKPDAEAKPDTETKPDTEAKPDGTADTEKVYDVGPQPPKGSGTE